MKIDIGLGDGQRKIEDENFVDKADVKLIVVSRVNDMTVFIFRGSQYV